MAGLLCSFSSFYTVVVSAFKVYEGYVDVNGGFLVVKAYQNLRWAKVLRSPPRYNGFGLGLIGP